MKIKNLIKVCFILIVLLSSSNLFSQAEKNKVEDSLNNRLNEIELLITEKQLVIDSLKNVKDDDTLVIDLKNWEVIKELTSSSPLNDWLPSVLAIIVVLLTAYLNYRYTKKQFENTNKYENEKYLKGQIAQFQSLVYTTFGLMVSLKQIKKAHPSKVDIVDEFKNIYLNNSQAVKLLFEIKMHINSDSKLSKFLDEYLDKGIVKVSGEEPKSELDAISTRLLELNNLINNEMITLFKNKKETNEVQ